MFFSRMNFLHKNTFCKWVCYGVVMKSPRTGQASPRNVIAGRMRQARMSFDPPLTQDELSGRLAARQAFLDRVAITKIESGQRCVFDYELPALAETLKVDVRWLLGIQDIGGPPKKKRKGAVSEL